MRVSPCTVRWSLLACVGVGAAWYALSPVTIAQQEDAAEIAQSAETSPAILDHPARPLYMEHCASCHGAYLQGGSAPGFLDGEWRFGSSDWDLSRNIQHGISAYGMPNYGELLSGREIRSLVDYLKKAPTELGVTPPPVPEMVQTRDYDAFVDVVVDSGLREAWSIDFANERRALVTEKPGGLRWLTLESSGKGELSAPIEGVPSVRYGGQGGMLDVAFDPSYNASGDGSGANDWVYLSYSHGPNDRGMTRVVRGKIVNGSWVDQETVWQAEVDDYMRTMHHYGCRIVFDNAGHLFFAIGDRGNRPDAQKLDKPNGKIHRVKLDGSIPSDNPFVGRDDVYESIYSYGHRNPQGMAIDPETGALWITEHGPMGGDELNYVEKGKNYGWPVISYGINYNGRIITDEISQAGMEQPAAYWTPSIAVCGLDIYRGGDFERWDGNLFAGGLAHQEVRRIVVDGDNAIHQEVVLKGLGRVRDVCCGPDGHVYVVMNGPDRIVRLRHDKRALRQ